MNVLALSIGFWTALAAPKLGVADDAARFGIVASVTGDLKPWDDESLMGARLAIDEFNAATLACDALSRAKTDDPASLRVAIEDTVGFKGVTGTITMKGHHGNPPKGEIVVQVTTLGAVFAKAYGTDQLAGRPK